MAKTSSKYYAPNTGYYKLIPTSDVYINCTENSKMEHDNNGPLANVHHLPS